MEYHVANGTALAEYLIGAYFWPQWKMSQSLSLFGASLLNRFEIFKLNKSVGLGLAFGGQVLRSVAMIQAASNFSHQVAFRKVESHQLVTHGVYG
jgi:protein-S-isoprenylcysteine O-methyltransferase